MKFQIQSKDVIHDFWVPDFRMKIDAVPGITTSYRVTPKQDSIGVHRSSYVKFAYVAFAQLGFGLMHLDYLGHRS